MDAIMDKVRNWWYTANDKKSTGGLIFMVVCIAIFLGALGWMFL